MMTKLMLSVNCLNNNINKVPLRGSRPPSLNHPLLKYNIIQVAFHLKKICVIPKKILEKTQKG